MPRIRFRHSAPAVLIADLEDAENLGWKLDRVVRQASPEALLESYHIERSQAADENIRKSTRSTDFMAPEFALRSAVAQGGAVARKGNRIRQAHGQWWPPLGALGLRYLIVDFGWRGVARRPASRGVDGGCADNKTRWRGRISHRCFPERRQAFTLLDAFANGAAIDPPNDVGAIHVGGKDSWDPAGLLAARYDGETRNRLSAPARRLRRRALSKTNAGRGRGGA